MWLPSFLRRPRIYVISCAGLRNFGDDAIARYWVEELKARYPRADIILEAFSRKHAARMHPQARCVSLLWPFVMSLRKTGFSAAQMWESPTIDEQTRFLRSKLPAQLDAIHFVGGGYLNDVWSANLVMLKCASRLADLTGARLTASGIGITPLSEQSARLIAPVLDRFDHLDFRDDESLLQLQAAGLRRQPSVCCTMDDLILSIVDGQRHFRRTLREPRINVCTHAESSVDGEQVPDLLPALTSAITAFRSQHPAAEIVFHEYYPDSDSVYVEAIARQFGRCRVARFTELWDGVDFAPADLFLGTRFHFQLIASLLGASGQSFFWNDYYRTKLLSISGWGHGTRQIFDMRRPKAGALPPPEQLPEARSVDWEVHNKRTVVDALFPARLGADARHTHAATSKLA